jgi:ferric-dicitrate binding protein FerR (iron transport regulator)
LTTLNAEIGGLLAGAGLVLERGTVRAHVAKQTEEKTPRNLVFVPANAEATVKGTSFALMWDEPNSLIAVAEGRVSIRRLRDGYTVVVEAGEYAHVENGGPFFTWPLRALPRSRRERIQFSN